MAASRRSKSLKNASAVYDSQFVQDLPPLMLPQQLLVRRISPRMRALPVSSYLEPLVTFSDKEISM